MAQSEPDLVERVAGHIGWRRDLLPESKAEAMEQARLILLEVADWFSEQRSADEIDDTFAAKAYAASILRGQAAEEGEDNANREDS